jgi:hypothetical protein
MTGKSLPDPFGAHPDWTTDPPRPVTPIPANMAGKLRGQRVLVGLPGLGWRGDMRADEKVVQGSRTYVPVMPEADWYRAEAEQTEVFAPLVPLERVWVEELGLAGLPGVRDDLTSRLVSLDEPPRRPPVAALDGIVLTGRRAVRMLDDNTEQRDLRVVTEIHTSNDGEICVRVAQEQEWYRWGWSGRTPRTLEVPVQSLWLE